MATVTGGGWSAHEGWGTTIEQAAGGDVMGPQPSAMVVTATMAGDGWAAVAGV